MLNRQTYFIKERAGLLKLTDTYDILDPDTGTQIGIAHEQISGLMKALRLVVNKQMLPTRVDVREGADPEAEDKLIFSIHRGFTLFRSRVEIRDAGGTLLGYFKSKLFSLGGAFRVYDAQDNEVAQVKGNWKGWTFRFLDKNENEIGTISKKWAGIGKELFTSADNYIIALNDEPEPGKALLLLAAGLAVDIIYKEGGNG